MSIEASEARPRLTDLSFVADRDGKMLPKATKGELPRCFWHVPRDINAADESALGERLALEYLAFEAANRGGPGHLQMIVSDMPRALTAVEISFLTMVSYAAAAGRHEAVRVAAYWDRCRAEDRVRQAQKREAQRERMAELRKMKAQKRQRRLAQINDGPA